MGFKTRRTIDAKPLGMDHGKHSLWYIKTSCRCTAGVLAVIAVCVYGASLVELQSIESYPVGVNGFVLAGCLWSLAVSIMALLILFLTRDHNRIHPGWLLSFDLLAILLFIVVLLFSYWAFDNTTNATLENVFKLLRVVWVMSIMLEVLHLTCFIFGIRDTHVRRKNDKARKNKAKVSDSLDTERQAEDFVEIDLQDMVPSDSQIAERGGGRQLESSDGSNTDLTAAHRVGSPAIHRLELPGHAANSQSNEVLPIDLSTTMSSGNSWHDGKASVRSFA